MKKALIFNTDNKQIITAQEVLCNPELFKGVEFVDPEEEFRVTFVRDCKGHTGPYFRLYLSREEYHNLSPERKNRYDFLLSQRHYQESPWHRSWEEKLEPYGKTEKIIKSSNFDKYKRTDFFCPANNTCVEFQHSYIANDFEERNDFYAKEGLQVIWLYDLTSMSVKENGENSIILENNAKGFFRIAEDPDNLKKHFVFIQVKSGTIYQVKEIARKEINNNLKSTIRSFHPEKTFSEDEFVNFILNFAFQRAANESETDSLFTIKDIWKKSYSAIIITDGKKTIKITGRKNGEIYRDLSFGTILYKYVDWNKVKNKSYERSSKNYSLSYDEENAKKWKLLKIYERKKSVDNLISPMTLAKNGNNNLCEKSNLQLNQYYNAKKQQNSTTNENHDSVSKSEKNLVSEQTRIHEKTSFQFLPVLYKTQYIYIPNFVLNTESEAFKKLFGCGKSLGTLYREWIQQESIEEGFLATCIPNQKCYFVTLINDNGTHFQLFQYDERTKSHSSKNMVSELNMYFKQYNKALGTAEAWAFY